MILYINACVRERSGTRQLAEFLLENMHEPYTEVRLSDLAMPRVDKEYLNRRDLLARQGRFDDPFFDLARQFAAADRIVIAAPYWDMSFPASLKQYLELVNAVGVTFRYTPQGVPQGLCRASALYYVTTAGGHFAPEEYGFGYVQALARGYYGIPRVEQIRALGLDIDGADREGILRECMAQISERIRSGELL